MAYFIVLVNLKGGHRTESETVDCHKGLSQGRVSSEWRSNYGFVSTTQVQLERINEQVNENIVPD